MKFTFHIRNYDNAAMVENQTGETARLLKETAEKIEAGYLAGILRDENGNKVGSWAFTKN